LLSIFSNYVSDNDNLRQVLPHLCYLLEDTESVVVCEALQTLTKILYEIKQPFLTHDDCQMFEEIIWQDIEFISKAKDSNVARCFAELVASLSQAANYLFQLCKQIRKAEAEKMMLTSTSRIRTD
jgi:hypothetical protein